MRRTVSLALLCCTLLCASLCPRLFAVEQPAGALRSASGQPTLKSLTADFSNCRLRREEGAKRLQAIKDNEALLNARRLSIALLRPALAKQRECEKALAALEKENFTHIDLKGRIDSYLSAANPMPQELSILNGFLDDLKAFGRDLLVEEKDLKAIRAKLEKLLKTTPPPASFTVLDRFVFERIQIKNKPSFYVLKTPITYAQWDAVAQASGGTIPRKDSAQRRQDKMCTDLTWDEAQAFAAAFSRLAEQPVTLPNVSQAAWLNNRPQFVENLTLALWLDGRWLLDRRSGSTNLEERTALERFGMTMAPVWDPVHKLFRTQRTEDNIFGELPYAHAPVLGFLLTASEKVGWELQMQECRRKVLEENP